MSSSQAHLSLPDTNAALLSQHSPVGAKIAWRHRLRHNRP